MLLLVVVEAEEAGDPLQFAERMPIAIMEPKGVTPMVQEAVEEPKMQVGTAEHHGQAYLLVDKQVL